MSEIAIKVENLSKAYQLGDFSTGTLSRDIQRWWTMMRGNEDPFLTVGETNDRATKGTSDIVWSLKDINFEIKEGDAVGIIGRNGAGKSTLLKILSRVTSPTTGNIKVKGRIASLLEVGTGFHPDLTGRENIFLNGAILGMKKSEIKRQFDAIVDFAGIARYTDTPVKRYSSGMYVRLAFAVAAHLESEILIVDEVLSVGDADFQKKCLGKMSDVSQGQGRTVLFVSHNMGAVKQLCNTGILLTNGTLSLNSKVDQVIDAYMDVGDGLAELNLENDFAKPIQLLSLSLLNELGEKASFVKFNEKALIQFAVKHTGNQKGAVCSVEFKDKLERKIFTEQIDLSNFNGIATFLLEIPANLLRPNFVYITIIIHIPNVKIIERSDSVGFEIIDVGSEFSIYGDTDNGMIFSGAAIKVLDIT